MAKLKNLESLNLWSNKLTSLPSWLGKLSKLEHLDYSWNPIKSAPAIEKLTQLETLRVSDNQLPGLIDKIEGLQNLSWFYRSKSRTDVNIQLNNPQTRASELESLREIAEDPSAWCPHSLKLSQ